MSSSYRVLCLSHDPAIITDAEWHSSSGREAAAVAAASPAGHEALRGHVGCDLLVGRYSYPLVEVGCPAGATAPDHLGYHPHAAQWVDAGWLRLLAAAAVTLADSTLSYSVPSCWTAERARRLRYELGVTGAEPATAEPQAQATSLGIIEHAELLDRLNAAVHEGKAWSRWELTGLLRQAHAAIIGLEHDRVTPR